MIGQIESYNPDIQTGVIKSGDKFYDFHLTDWTVEVPPDPGDEVSFDAADAVAKKVCLAGVIVNKPKAVKYKYVAGILGLLLGGAGMHRLYLGYYGIALAQLAVTLATAGYGLLWGFVEGVLILAGHLDKDAKGRPLR
ncbi:TM2 domain-containing protein [Candidatus Methylobacter favarea]|uniref:TM2 domain-containing protein n=1 Tax=Candidatus Methylobacter favarea TaxID=2707345 RepID=A0A8S0X371_9GAMM|nr:NINE protein [Candidatus Methylobacter favarea]CAA9892494.1 TM2 domain-containing protein [Candidatus Methylobacter favarea]